MQTHNIEKSKTPVPRKSLLAVALAAAFIAKYSIADTYILGGEANENNVGSSSSPVSWSDVEQWKPAAVPSGADEVNWAPSKTGSHRQAYVALDGDYAIGSLTTKYRTLHLYRASDAIKNPVTFTVNGQLGGDDYQQLHTVNSGVRLVLPSGATMICSKGGHTQTGLSVSSGGEAEIFGTVQSRVMTLSVTDGGALVFSPSSYTISSWGRSDNDHDEINIVGSGTISFPNGITMTGSASTPNNQLNQSGGTAVFGGGFASELPWDYTWSGGSLNVVSNSAFGANVALIVPASSSVALDVASGKTFSVANLAADSTATITKTGAGTFVYAPTTAAIAVNEGGIGFASASEYDLSNVTFGSDTTIVLNTLGATISAISATTGNAKFVADLSGATAGTAVLNSANSAVLEKAKADLEEESAVPAGFGLQISNGVLSLEAQSEYRFVGTGSTTNILDVAGWGGSLPPNGADVAIDGEGVVATLQNGDSFPAWNSIEVKNGATLRIESSTGLIPIELNKSASLEIASGVTVPLSSASDLSGIAVASQVPILSIESGAILNVPGEMKFKNLDLRLFGKINAPEGGCLYFGYADSAETTYFAMCATNGVIATTNIVKSYAAATPCFVCPSAGGRVEVVRQIELDGVVLERKSSHEQGSIYDAVKVGVNNPTDAPFDVLFNNFTMQYRGHADFGGAATVTFRNSTLTRPVWQAWSSQGRWNVNDAAKIIFDNTAHYYEYPDGNSVGWFSSVAGTEAFVLTNSTVMWSRPAGNDNGTLTVYDSFYDCAYDAYAPSQGQTLPDLFDGLGELNIPQGSFCAIRALNHVTWDANDDAAERICKVAKEVKIVGDGDLFVTNGVSGRYFEVIMQSTNNTCTGTLTVDSPENYDTKLYFADGANWAGTVVAGNVALTNLVDAAAASTNEFETLDLVGNFPVRVWTDENGRVVSHDGLNVETYVKSGGKLELVVIGEPLVQGFSIGTVGEGSPLPDVQGPWTARRGQDGTLWIKPRRGMQIIVL